MPGLPPDFSPLPVFAAGKPIPHASPQGALGPNGVRAYRHTPSHLRVVLFDTPGPLVSSSILVATEPLSDAGHPHTLEHIVFLGSHNHPHRGYLDNLANRCLADGTNAYTANEYTAYTATTAGLDGLLQLLPAYLDHVLRPIINRPAFDSEVYHVLPDGREAGVVFCEMHARENTEMDLTENHLRPILFKGSSHAYASGGLCHQIRTLTNEDIARFHREQYCAANVSVVVGGSHISDRVLLSALSPLLRDISTSPSFHPGSPQWKTPIRPPPLPPVTRKVVPFPSTDLSIGTLVLGWHGPGTDELLEGTAVNILLHFLADDVWSPLNQKYVEVERQLASEIDYSRETYLGIGSFELFFQGVNHITSDESDVDSDGTDDDANDDDDEGDSSSESDRESSSEVDEDSFLLSGKLEADVMVYLESICNSRKLPGGIKGIHTAIDKERESFLSDLESSPHESIPHFLVEELIYGEDRGFTIGEEFRGFLARNELLKTKGEQFWIDMLEKYFVKAPRVELIMVPNKELIEEHAKKEKEAQEERVERVGKEALEKVGKENEERIASLKPVKFDSRSFPPMPNTMNIARFPYVTTTQRRELYTAQTVALETDFVYCSFFIDTERLTTTQRALLPVLSELVESCDIVLPDGHRIAYTENAREVTEATIGGHDVEVSVGFGNGMAEQCVMVTYGSSPDMFDEATRLVLRTMFESEVTEERVSSVCQTLLSQSIEEMRDGDSVLRAAMVLAPFVFGRWEKGVCNAMVSNFVGSFATVSWLAEEFGGKKRRAAVRERVMGEMEGCLESLRGVKGGEVLVQIAGREPEGLQEVFERRWREKVEKDCAGRKEVKLGNGGMKEDLRVAIARRIEGRIGETVKGVGTVGKVVGVGGLESNYMGVCVDCEVCVGHADWGALSVTTEMLSRMEGPLCDAVRVSGLAYDVSLWNETWRGQLCLTISDSNAVAKAWQASVSCLEEFGRRLDNIDESLEADVESARMSTLFQLHRGRRAPTAIARGMLSRTAVAAGTDDSFDTRLERDVEDVRVDDVRRVFHQYVRRLVQDNVSRVVVVVCESDGVDECARSFATGDMPLRLTRCATEDLYPAAVKRVVADLAKH